MFAYSFQWRASAAPASHSSPPHTGAPLPVQTPRLLRSMEICLCFACCVSVNCSVLCSTEQNPCVGYSSRWRGGWWFGDTFKNIRACMLLFTANRKQHTTYVCALLWMCGMQNYLKYCVLLHVQKAAGGLRLLKM